MGHEPSLPKPKTFTDGDGWLERFIEKARVAPSKCCAACRRGTQTHNGGCNDTHCQCHSTPKRMCTDCGRTYSATDMPFHMETMHPTTKVDPDE